MTQRPDDLLTQDRRGPLSTVLVCSKRRFLSLHSGYFVDAECNPLAASKHQYRRRFEKGKLPPAAAFWSVAMKGMRVADCYFRFCFFDFGS